MNRKASEGRRERELGGRLRQIAKSLAIIELESKRISAHLKRMHGVCGFIADEFQSRCEAIPFDEFYGRLSLRAANLLEEHNVTDSHALASLTVDKLCNFRGCGRQTMVEIMNVLHEYGVELPQNDGQITDRR